MRTPRFVIAGITIATILIVFLVSMQTGVLAQNVSIQPTQSQPLSIQELKTRGLPNPQKQVGQPAIIPLHSSSNGETSNVVGSQNIKKTDIEAYVLKHPFPSGPIAAGKSLKILSIDLITSKECAIRFNGEETGLPDDALVYYVKIQGPFTTTMVPLPPQAKPFPLAAFGIEVFNAQTGNLLIWTIPTPGSKPLG